MRALVVGGSGHLGAEVCRTLAHDGCDVVFTYARGRERAEGLLAELGGRGRSAHSVQLDLRDVASIRRVVAEACAQLGGIDALVVASGLATGAPDGTTVSEFVDVSEGAYDAMMNVNVRGVFFACQEVARLMTAQHGGRIVLVGSIDGVKPVPAPVDYACCKAALWGMTQAMAKTLGAHGILVNMVAPGILEGGIATLLSEDLRQEYLRHCSLRRVGSFAEIARVIAFLAGPRNTYVTGQAVILDGGL